MFAALKSLRVFLLVAGYTLSMPPESDIMGETLCSAIEHEDIRGMREAIAAGADVNFQDGAPIVGAVNVAFFNGVDVLLKAGANPGLREGTILLDAIDPMTGEGHPKIVRRLLEAGVFPQDIKDFAAAMAAFEGKRTLLAALKGHVDMRTAMAEAELIDAANRVDSTGIAAALKNGARPSSRAADVALGKVAGDSDALKLLLNSGVNPNSIGGAIALRNAARAGNDTAVAALRAAGAPMPTLLAERLIMAAENGHDDMVTFHLSMLSEVHYSDMLSAFSAAARNGHLDTIRAFLASDFKMEPYMWMALKRAAVHGRVSVIETLLEAGADPTYDGYAALFGAALKGQTHAALVLVRAAKPDHGTLLNIAKLADSMHHGETAKTLRDLAD